MLIRYGELPHVHNDSNAQHATKLPNFSHSSFRMPDSPQQEETQQPVSYTHLDVYKRQSVAYANSVESALGIQIPKRAEWIRAILLEVERLHSHLLNLGLSSHFTGFDTGFMQFFRVREKSMTLAEVLTDVYKRQPWWR